MSDESPPPPLRLKPRTRPESETPPAEPPAADPAEEGKLRLKPKLNLDPTPEPALEPAPEPAPEPEAAPVEPTPALVEEEAPPPPMPLPEEGKVKLKIKLPGAAAQEATPLAQGTEVPPALPPFPVVAPPPEEEVTGAPPLLIPPETPASPPGKLPVKFPGGGSRPAVFVRPRVPAALLAAERRRRLWKYAVIAVGGVILAAAVIGGAYLKFTEPPPIHVPPRPMPVPVAPPVAVVAPPTPAKAPPTEEAPPVDPGSNVRVDSTATVELAPGVTAMTESIKAVPNASAAFRSFVASAKISGVYSGKPPRAFINGRLVRTGDMLDDVQEIYFDSIDVPSRSLVFKDARGATVSRRY